MRRFLRAILVFGSLVSAVAYEGGRARGEFEAQPAGKHSTLIDKDGNEIRDDVFAGLIKNILITNGQSAVADAKFFFNQCYGGGFLDDISSAMADKVKWVGGAATKGDETAIGQVSAAENDARAAGGQAKFDAIWQAATPYSFWGKQMIDNLDDNETVLKSIQDAISEDPTGQNQAGATGKLRTGQSGSGNGGETITLKNPAVTSHHAILFAGDTDSERHYNTIKGVYDQLKSVWGDPATNNNVTITVLFGDGQKNSKGENLPAAWNAKAATTQGLKDALAGVGQLLNPNEQFLFYGYDHGGTVTEVVPITPPSAPALTVIPFGLTKIPTPLLLTLGELEGLILTENNNARLQLEYNWSGIPAQQWYGDFKINGVSLFTPFNYLPGQHVVDVLVPEGLLQQTNMLEFYNQSTINLDILGLNFFTGGINDTPVSFVNVPEPATGLLLLLPLLMMRRRRA